MSDNTIVEQNNITLSYTVVDQDEAAVNLTGATIKWSIRKSILDSVELTKTTSNGITITNAAGGLFDVYIDDQDTLDLSESNPDGVQYYMEAVITDTGGSVYTITTDAIEPDRLIIRPRYTEA